MRTLLRRDGHLESRGEECRSARVLMCIHASRGAIIGERGWRKARAVDRVARWRADATRRDARWGTVLWRLRPRGEGVGQAHASRAVECSNDRASGTPGVETRYIHLRRLYGGQGYSCARAAIIVRCARR